jgi:hypothetical protein
MRFRNAMQGMLVLCASGSATSQIERPSLLATSSMQEVKWRKMEEIHFALPSEALGDILRLPRKVEGNGVSGAFPPVPALSLGGAYHDTNRFEARRNRHG